MPWFIRFLITHSSLREYTPENNFLNSSSLLPFLSLIILLVVEVAGFARENKKSTNSKEKSTYAIYLNLSNLTTFILVTSLLRVAIRSG